VGYLHMHQDESGMMHTPSRGRGMRRIADGCDLGSRDTSGRARGLTEDVAWNDPGRSGSATGRDARR
jgi:hypothetical protein